MPDADKGNVGISRDVVTSIAGIAISEIDGIANLRPGDTAFRRGEGMKRHVDTNVDGDAVTVTARLTVIYGFPILKVARQVQERIKSEIERMTGLQVRAVNVDVQKLVRDGERTEEKGDEWDEGGEQG
ncbi:MAG: Asp23/Gls24 family envelope stress response protein [Candidatus Bipolaricaulota bacterium]